MNQINHATEQDLGKKSARLFLGPLQGERVLFGKAETMIMEILANSE